nr:UPF0175 family protein [Candidatus Sigynarchaeota archaeon]
MVSAIIMSVLSVRIDPVLEEKLAFLMREKKIIDKSAYVRQLLDKSIMHDLIDFLASEVGKRNLSAWKAAEMAGISLRQMMAELASRDVSTYSKEALMEDMAFMEGKKGSRSPRRA